MLSVEVITSVQRRRRWSAEQKKAMVLEAEQLGMSVSIVARKYEVHPCQLFRWRRLFHEGALVAVRAEEELVPSSEVRGLKRRIQELERMLGRKTLENEILKDALEIAREKTDLADALAQKGRHPMKALCETLGVSRSRQYEKCQEGTRPRRRHYRRAEDDFYLVLIREIVNHRVTSGYRRVTAHLNRMLHGHGHVPVNPKRVYRLMKIGGLLLQRSTGHSSRVHEGTIVTTRSNLRLCSDVFEIACWSKERIRVAFTLDCCDWEVISYVATMGGIDGGPAWFD